MFSCAYANIHSDKIDSPVASDFIAQSNARENSLRNYPRQVDRRMELSRPDRTHGRSDVEAGRDAQVTDPNRLAQFRREYEAPIAPYFDDNRRSPGLSTYARDENLKLRSGL